MAFQPSACRAPWWCMVVASFAQDKRVIQGQMFVDPAVIELAAVGWLCFNVITKRGLYTG